MGIFSPLSSVFSKWQICWSASQTVLIHSGPSSVSLNHSCWGQKTPFPPSVGHRSASFPPKNIFFQHLVPLFKSLNWGGCPCSPVVFYQHLIHIWFGPALPFLTWEKFLSHMFVSLNPVLLSPAAVLAALRGSSLILLHPVQFRNVCWP